MKGFSYKPQPVSRIYIPKANGDMRPLGIPSYEDKLVQGVMADILTEIYEPIFLDCSYGFRPNRDCHQAIKRLDNIIMKENTNYIVEADIKGFFNNVNHDSEQGTPQGGLISPILANVYLHYVLDLWFELYVKVKCKRKCNLVRYCDDYVACFEREEEGKWFYTELKERLAKFDLELEETKTRIFPFGKSSKAKESFDFLGFTIFDSTTRTRILQSMLQNM